MNQEPYGAGVKSPRPAWATWLIVALVIFIAGIAGLIFGGASSPLMWLFGVGLLVCLVGAGISALSGVRKL
jgi:hypothetical protein